MVSASKEKICDVTDPFQVLVLQYLVIAQSLVYLQSAFAFYWPQERLIRIDCIGPISPINDFGSWARGNENPSKQTLTGRETMAGPPTVKALAPAAREKRVATAEARMVGCLVC